MPMVWNRSTRVGDNRSLTVAALMGAALNQLSYAKFRLMGQQ